ncbi:hypothetical protein ACTNCJ_07755 [Lactobacillus amylovorus]|uniref:hypothetical protein n=2 Tax=Lactobacillus amylovorus TaxID=1604 RepID=UPI003F8A7C5D
MKEDIIMPKPKYPIPNNNFPRFINEYLSGHSDSQNDFARKINKLVPKKLAIPIDKSEMKSGNSNIFSWKKGNRPKEPVIREALCKICAIDYIETLFLIPANATEYLMKVYNYIKTFIEDFDIGETEISLNMYNIGFIISSNTRAKKYLNLNYLINLIIRAEEDRKDIFNNVALKKFCDDGFNENDYSILFEPQPPFTFFEFSDSNLHMINEKNNSYLYPPSCMFSKLSESFNNLQPDLEFMLSDDDWNTDNYNYNYFRMCLFNDTSDENILCFNTAINLLIEWIEKLDKFYLNELAKMGIDEDNTFYKRSAETMLENNDLFGKRK